MAPKAKRQLSIKYSAQSFIQVQLHIVETVRPLHQTLALSDLW